MHDYKKEENVRGSLGITLYILLYVYILYLYDVTAV